MSKYVKLIAKPDTWFKAGTEVFDDDCFGKRYTLEAYNKWRESGIILARGIRVCEHDYELKLGYKLGEESGSWKGGCIGCSYDILPNETPEQCLRRMEQERKF